MDRDANGRYDFAVVVRFYRIHLQSSVTTQPCNMTVLPEFFFTWSYYGIPNADDFNSGVWVPDVTVLLGCPSAGVQCLLVAVLSLRTPRL